MLEDIIKMVQESQDDDFRMLFARASGYMVQEAKYRSGETCSMDEVGELFQALYDKMVKNETPAGGAAGESK